MSVLSPISRWGRTLTVERQAPGAYGDDGIYVRGATSTFPILAAVEPIRTALRDDPEGKYIEDRLLIMTATQLFADRPMEPDAPRPDLPPQDADVITIDDARYRVDAVNRFDELGGVSYEAQVTRITTP